MRRWLILFLTLSFVACSSSETTQEEQTQKPKQVSQTQKSVHDFVPPEPLDPKDIVPPQQAIKNLDAMVEGYHLGQDLTPEQKHENANLKKKIIRGTFDIKELCRLSLGKHWATITDGERMLFVELMTALLETTATFSREKLKGKDKFYSIDYQKETYDDKEKTRSTVVSIMKVPKEKMRLNITYKLLLTPYGWKIFDMIVDDASLLTNYKFQFDRIMTQFGFAELIERMKKKLETIRRKKAA